MKSHDVYIIRILDALKNYPSHHQAESHSNDVIMNAIASQIICISVVCSTVCSGADEIKHQSSASVPFVRGIPQWPVDSPHKGPVTRKMFPIDDVVMVNAQFWLVTRHQLMVCWHFVITSYRSLYTHASVLFCPLCSRLCAYMMDLLK